MAVEALDQTDVINRDVLADRFRAVRDFTDRLCEPLEPEDCVIQSMPDVSPTRWHAAHTTWFFETFVLAKALPAYTPVDPAYEYLFNSYYNTVGQQFPRPNRGLLSRPTVAEVFAYRSAIDERIARLLNECDDRVFAELAPIVEIGLHHEQQHQELLLTDIKHVFSCNPLYPVYREVESVLGGVPPSIQWLSADEGLYWVGHDGDGFAYDNESPRHRVFVPARQLANRLVTNGEYLEFICDGGYERPELWLSAGWNAVCESGWHAPLYWSRDGDDWRQFTLSGLRPVDLAQPVCHVSYFEADAFARWSGARLPTEAEWELAAVALPREGNFVERELFQPVATCGEGLRQMFGDVWEWTASPYEPYPGYAPPDGALGEYNGKFMCNQYVLRGGSCATSQSHIRATYRNFFPPDARWQFSGIRLAQ